MGGFCGIGHQCHTGDDAEHFWASGFQPPERDVDHQRALRVARQNDLLAIFVAFVVLVFDDIHGFDHAVFDAVEVVCVVNHSQDRIGSHTEGSVWDTEHLHRRPRFADRPQLELEAGQDPRYPRADGRLVPIRSEAVRGVIGLFTDEGVAGVGASVAG